MSEPSVDQVVEEVKASERVDQYDWQSLAKKHGYEFTLKVIENFSPEALSIMPKLPGKLIQKTGEGYLIPDYHKDALWLYGTFLFMYLKLKPESRDTALAWLRDSLKNMPDAWK